MLLRGVRARGDNTKTLTAFLKIGKHLEKVNLSDLTSKFIFFAN